MMNIFKIAWRNLLRYRRRTLLTSSLIAIGVALVIIFSGVGMSFKNSMIGILTNSSIADMQVHKKGYVESIDNIPLNIFIDSTGIDKIKNILTKNKQIESYSLRIKLGAMISNYAQTSAIRLTAVYPDQENKTCPALVERIKGVTDPNQFVKQGEIVLPKNLAKGLSLIKGSEVVIVATNRDGSVNGMSFKVGGIVDAVLGPQGKDGYIHLEDAKKLLRIDGDEISEVAIRLKDFGKLHKVSVLLKKNLSKIQDETGMPMFEGHTWEQLSPFASIAKIVDLLLITVRIILISIVLISIMNIMMMSVYERTSEIGTIAAIGTRPGKILSLFLSEGIFLGVISIFIGTIIGTGVLFFLKTISIKFKFGMMAITLTPAIPWGEVVLTALIVIVISILASLQPAYKASRLEPVDALRHI
ncbi:MAG TPA: ABC transporter substrate-binding protein [Candidatus Margulisbacteria bacterium]|nr:MAG: ABC transporter substrate-binding protein [Bacteroidetes bacterium GWF2_43_11]OGI11307.1 MAG: ABC transporter substrate-binding protein [Candidatus Margulisbacteria bacterium GWE2_39_32]HCT83696.1 ABC transporter substrate-binding protein [Candidatus Margulisiibacteriota bacterium]